MKDGAVEEMERVFLRTFECFNDSDFPGCAREHVVHIEVLLQGGLDIRIGLEPDMYVRDFG